MLLTTTDDNEANSSDNIVAVIKNESWQDDNKGDTNNDKLDNQNNNNDNDNDKQHVKNNIQAISKFQWELRYPLEMQRLIYYRHDA